MKQHFSFKMRMVELFVFVFGGELNLGPNGFVQVFGNNPRLNIQQQLGEPSLAPADNNLDKEPKGMAN